MTVERNFILHLSLLDGIGPATIQTIITHLKRSGTTVSDLYLFSSAQWMYKCGLTDRIARTIVTGLADIKILEIELMLIERNNIQWATVFDEQYPLLLREIYLPPSVLYWQGGAFDDSVKSLAIVGSRKSNSYGQQIISALLPEMISAGWTIVSGGALGIDTLAHEAALKAGGKTIVVLGSGLLNIYPSTNKRLFKTISDKGGLIVSSFSLQAEAKPGNFPARNRIIAGLSHGCLVVQAAEKSGALITAHYALEQGREVFAVPGLIHDELSVGCHKLIQNGAKLVMSGADILGEFGERLPMKDVQITLHQAQQLLQEDAQYTENQKKIMQVCRQQSSLDDIMQETLLDMSIIQAELFELQLAGKVEQGFTGMWMALV